MSAKTERYIDSLTAKGRIFFTLADLCRELTISRGAGLTALARLKKQIRSQPESTLCKAEQLRARAEQMLFIEGEIQALLIMAHCCWCAMDYRQGLKLIKIANDKQSQLDSDDHLPEILHTSALQYWGLAKYFSAQQCQAV